jgi:hypothetical protein
MLANLRWWIRPHAKHYFLKHVVGVVLSRPIASTVTLDDPANYWKKGRNDVPRRTPTPRRDGKQQGPRNRIQIDRSFHQLPSYFRSRLATRESGGIPAAKADSGLFGEQVARSTVAPNSLDGRAAGPASARHGPRQCLGWQTHERRELVVDRAQVSRTVPCGNPNQ